MLPEKRATFIGVAGVAGFVDGVLQQEFRACRAVRIVTVGTCHPAGSNWVRGQVMALCALQLMAGIANLALRVSRKRLVLRPVDFVTGRAGYVVARMHTATPVHAPARVVAVEAGAALHLGGRSVDPAENKIGWRPHRRIVRVPHMRPARSVTRLASRLRGHAVTREVNRQDRLLFGRIVAARADMIAAGARLQDARRLGGMRADRCQRAGGEHHCSDVAVQEANTRGWRKHARSLMQGPPGGLSDCRRRDLLERVRKHRIKPFELRERVVYALIATCRRGFLDALADGDEWLRVEIGKQAAVGMRQPVQLRQVVRAPCRFHVEQLPRRHFQKMGADQLDHFLIGVAERACVIKLIRRF